MKLLQHSSPRTGRSTIGNTPLHRRDVFVAKAVKLVGSSGTRGVTRNKKLWSPFFIILYSKRLMQTKQHEGGDTEEDGNNDERGDMCQSESDPRGMTELTLICDMLRGPIQRKPASRRASEPNAEVRQLVRRSSHLGCSGCDRCRPRCYHEAFAA